MERAVGDRERGCGRPGKDRERYLEGTETALGTNGQALDPLQVKLAHLFPINRRNKITDLHHRHKIPCA